MTRHIALSLLLVAALTATAFASCATNNPCGYSGCCDASYGTICYSVSTQSCTKDVQNGKNYVCAAGQSACAGACFNPNTQTCTNGKVSNNPRITTKASTTSTVRPSTSSTTKATTSSTIPSTTRASTSSVPSTSSTSSTVRPTTSTSTSQAAATSTSQGAATSSSQGATTATPSACVQGNCPAGMCGCGAACYSASQYCCAGGSLVQIAFCGAPQTSSSSAAQQSSSSSAAKTTTSSTSTRAPAPTSSSNSPSTSSTASPASSSTTSRAATTSSQGAATATNPNPVVPPVPVPISVSCGSSTCPAGQSCCAGSCYDPTLFGCSSNVDGSNAFLCPAPQPSAQPKFWMETIPHTGIAAFNPSPSTYVVYRNVKSFGAKGDGVTDDTAAINAAITAYGRCGQGCDSTTIRPAVVYFPAGSYVISAPIIQYYFTQLIGDATNLPRLVAAPGFVGRAMIDSDPYASNGNNWYTNQNNFYRQVRNFVLDFTRTTSTWGTTGIHWQVAQATSVTNVVFQMSTATGNNHQGIWMENGSGGFVSDLVFYGGKFAMWVGNQQFTSRNITIYNADTAIYMNWNWGWTFKTLTISGCRIGLDMSSTADSGSQLVGSVILVDVTMTNTVTGIVTGTTATSVPDTSGALFLDNGYFTGVQNVIAAPSGRVLLAGQAQGTLYVPAWAQGTVYNDQNNGEFVQGFVQQPSRPASLVGSNKNGYYFERQRPQYENYPVSSFVSVKDNGAYGDGIHDDTAAVAQTLAKYAGCRIIYFPAGTYLMSSTVVVPAGSRIVGEAWSQIMAKGAAFQDASNPVPMWQIGNTGDVGTAELSDLIFTASGPQPGAILVQWNIRDPAGQQGASGMWDCHFRVGGAAGTNQQVAQCPSLASPTPQCVGTFMLLHLTVTSSSYLENVWAWTADHDLDGNGQVSIYNGRGLLCESQVATWMYGTAVEHNVFYQYSFLQAKNVLLAMIQTETPYFQAAPPSPAPWVSNSEWSDPDFSGCPAGSPSCGMAWGMRHLDSSNVYLYGAGLYNFFRNYNQTCLLTEDCQDAMVDMQSPDQSNIYLYGLNTKATVTMVQTFGASSVLASDNVNTFCSSVHYLANAQ